MCPVSARFGTEGQCVASAMLLAGHYLMQLDYREVLFATASTAVQEYNRLITKNDKITTILCDENTSICANPEKEIMLDRERKKNEKKKKTKRKRKKKRQGTQNC